ncbi:MAG: M16 family metallopeptidase [Bacteroidia bacterium]
MQTVEPKVYELKNGLRVVFKPIPYTRTVHCGYVINAGSRDDEGDKMGMAHFIEHMIFKGTHKRKTFHILNYLESVGGDVNAYTTKEKTCFYASLASEYLDRATELLTDISFHSIFPKNELVKEQQVISEEIDMYRESPDEAIFEDFDEMIFPEHHLGRPILGTKESIRQFEQEHLLRHIRSSFTQGNVVYAIVGNVSEKAVEKIIDKYLAPLELPTGSLERIKPNGQQLLSKKVDITSGQAHEILGGRAYALRKDLYTPFLLLNNLLGGPAMNSRLNLNIREKHGLTYSISTFYSPFFDSGIWGIYYACEPKNLDRIYRMVQKELKELAEKPLGTLKFNQVKKQLSGQMILGYENLLTQMLSMAQDILDFNRIITFADYLEDIESVTAEQMCEAANEIYIANPLSRITYRQS